MSRSQRRREVGVGAFESFRVPFRRTQSQEAGWAKIPSYYYSGQSAQANAFQAPVRANPPGFITVKLAVLYPGVSPHGLRSYSVAESALNSAISYLYNLSASRPNTTPGYALAILMQRLSMSQPWQSNKISQQEVDTFFRLLGVREINAAQA